MTFKVGWFAASILALALGLQAQEPLAVPQRGQAALRWDGFRPFAALLLAVSGRAEDALVVIVNPASGVASLTRREVEEIFMGRQKRLPSGFVALPVEQLEPSQIRLRFYQFLVHLPLQEVRAYRARMYFSGQAQPPRQTESDAETIEVVLANKGAIGFLEKSKLDKRLHVVLELGGMDNL